MKKKHKNESSIEVKNVQKVVLSTIAFFAFMYIITAIITGELNFNNDNKNEEPIEAVIQYKEILAGETFTRPEQEYYVIFYKFDNKDAATVQTIIDKYSQGTNSLKVYEVNLSKGFNKSIYTEGTTKAGTSKISDLKVNDYTLIKIKNGKNIAHVEGKTAIKDYFTK